MTLDPQDTTPLNVYKLLIGSIVPRPIAFVSTLAADGTPNLAPFSFFTVASSNPPVICFSTSVRGDGGSKDTLNNVRATGEFVVNIVSESFAEQMNLTAGEYPPAVDEFQISRLTPIPSDLVKPFRVQESQVHMECRLRQIVEIGDGPMGGRLILGDVVRFHVNDAIIRDFRIDIDQLQPIGRLSGSEYCRMTDRFSIERPK